MLFLICASNTCFWETYVMCACLLYLEAGCLVIWRLLWQKNVSKVWISHYIIHMIWYKKNNAWVTVNNSFGVTSEAICQLFLQVTKSWVSSRVRIIGRLPHEWPKKSLFTVRNVLFYFLHRYTLFSMSWINNSAKNNQWLISQLSPRTVFFLTWHCDVTTVDLWHHTNVGYWHCDVIFIDCSSTCQLAIFTSE